MKVDLHIHTTSSDGRIEPAQVVKIAHELNLRAIAITDHDTIDGIPPAIEEAKKLTDVEVIPGIEINTYYKDMEIHILGYYIDYTGDYLRRVLTGLQQSRAERAKKIVDRLNELGIIIDFENVKVKASGPSMGRPHIAAVLIEKGFAESIEDAFEKYLNPGRPAYVPRERLTPFDAIDIVKQSTGIPVLAHPGLLKKQNIIDDLIKYGIMGIEVYHKDHSREQTDYYIKMAADSNLLLTGGSDSHGEKPLLIGSLDVPEECAEKLKEVKRSFSTN